MESMEGGRITRSTQRNAQKNYKSIYPAMNVIKQECDQDDPNNMSESEYDEDDARNIAGMFVDVKVEPAEVFGRDENVGGNEEEESYMDQGQSLKTMSTQLLLEEEPSGAKNIVAKLAQKLNSKLNTIVVPRPTDSLLECLEPEVSVATDDPIIPGNLYVCPWCPMTSSDPEAFEEHKNACHRVTRKGEALQHVCDVCGKRFARSCNLMRHYMMHSGERPFVCKDCGVTFVTGSDLTLHQKWHSPSQSSSGRSSHAQSLPGQSSSSDHVEETSAESTSDSVEENPPVWRNGKLVIIEKRWVCFKCNKEFCSKDILLEHQRSQECDLKLHPCHQCKKTFKTIDLLDKHLKRPHSLTCLICEKIFTWHHNLRTHMRAQHMVQYLEASKIFICLQCKKEFQNVDLIINHSCMHSWLRPYKCCVCKDTFRGDRDLKVHMRIHTGERPYACSECGETFTQKGNLTVHIRTHTGEKPFQCHECGRCFMKTSNLKEHMKVHQGKRGKGSESKDVSNIQKKIDVWADKDPTIIWRVSEMAKESNAFRAAIASKLMKTGITSLSSEETASLRESITERFREKKNSANFKDTIAERLKERGILSFGNGNISLRLLDRRGGEETEN